ncbi:metallophosphoesterase family protein [Poriferisphaera sp. WC338]|uniref:metallophosphoesterase family protein n=1 Tax=Poriferisphaera sp. WC338 TaxID=3425129 RepID=UPI003D81A8FD
MPKIALLSDSHGNAPITTAATKLLLTHHPDLMIHLGDIGNIAVLDALAVTNPQTSSQLETHIVFGNTDYNLGPLSQYAEDIGLHVNHPVGHITLPDNQTIGFTHGHDNYILSQLLHDNTTYILHGHTHLSTDTRQQNSRIINPGALTRAQQYTVAILDTHNGQLTFFPVTDA